MPRNYPQSFIDSQKEAWRRHVSLYQVLLSVTGDVVDYYLADYDSAVTATVGGTTPGTFTFQPFGHKRGKATSRTNLQVDEMELVMPNAEVPYLGTPVRLSFLAVKGYLDGATLNLFKWDAFNPAQTAVWHSGWIVQEV